TPGAVRRLKKSRKWYGTVAGKQTPLCTDKAKSQQLLNKLLTDATLRHHGMADPFEDHHKRPLADHLSDFRRELEARGNASRYTSVVISRLEAVFAGCGFHLIPDLAAAPAVAWLDDLRRKGRPRVTLPPGQEWFRVREVATVLGIKPASVGATVR